MKYYVKEKHFRILCGTLSEQYPLKKYIIMKVKGK